MTKASESTRPIGVVVSMSSSSGRASAGASAGGRPTQTTCDGPRTVPDGGSSFGFEPAGLSCPAEFEPARDKTT